MDRPLERELVGEEGSRECASKLMTTELKGRVLAMLGWGGRCALLWKDVWKKGLSDQSQGTEARSFFITLCTVFL